MKSLSKCIKTAAMGALFATTAMTSTMATAIESGPNGTVIMYLHTWNTVQNLCAQVTCVSIVPSGMGWLVTWR